MKDTDMEYISSKTIITKKKNLSWFGTEYNMNIYRGCCHGCIYCDSRSECYQIDDFDKVRAKENSSKIIRSELKSKQQKGVLATGSMSDPYNPHEKDLLLTREALQLIDTYNFGVAIATKSPLVVRDIDILQQIQKHSPVLVKITITTADDRLCKKIERNVAVSSERFRAIKELSAQGIYCGILFMPILPFINDSIDNVLSTIQLAHASGAKFIYPTFGLTLRNNQRAYYYQKIAETFPHLKEKYLQNYSGQYFCASPKSKELHSIFTEECKRLGLAYNMTEIIQNYKQGYEPIEISLF